MLHSSNFALCISNVTIYKNFGINYFLIHLHIVQQVPSIKFFQIHPLDPGFCGYRGMQDPLKPQRILKKSKTKFLATEEIIRVTSGSKTATQVGWDNVDSVSKPQSGSVNVHQRCPNLAKPACPKYLTLTENDSPSSHTPPHQAVQIIVNAKVDFTSKFQYCKKMQHTTDKGDSSTGSSSTLVANSESDLVLPQINIKVCNLDSGVCLKEKDNQNHTSDGRSKHEANLGSVQGEGTDHSNPKSHERNSSKIAPNHSSSPAFEVIWKGSFEILDIAKHQGMTPYMHFCEDLLAHPAATVSRKAYNFSKQIAGVMQFKLYPRSDLWTEIFKGHMPDSNDIALYFYPTNNERSKRKYSILLKYIEKNDMVMKSSMGCVELMVFASKLLPTDFQRLKGSFFMFGVFRRLRGGAKS